MATVLITGANRGLGLEFARQYAADGWDVIACCRHPDKAEALGQLAKQNRKVRAEQLDVVDADSIRALGGTLRDTAIDVLINNAGVASSPKLPYTPEHPEEPQRVFGTVDAEIWDDVLRINTIAPVMVTQTLLPQLRQGKERKIVMISSRLGSLAHKTDFINLPYRTSKAALNMAMVCGAQILKPEKFILVSFHPGWVRTDMGGREADIGAEESVQGMRTQIAQLTAANSGSYMNYKGDILPW